MIEQYPPGIKSNQDIEALLEKLDLNLDEYRKLDVPGKLKMINDRIAQSIEEKTDPYWAGCEDAIDYEVTQLNEAIKFLSPEAVKEK